MWRGGAQALDPNPHTGGWPALKLLSHPRAPVPLHAPELAGSGRPSPAQLQHHIVGAESAPFYLFARIVGALDRNGDRLSHIPARRVVYRTWRGFLAGLFVATNPLHVLTSST